VAHMHENQVERSVGSRDRVDGRTRPIAVLFLDNAVAARLWCVCAQGLRHSIRQGVQSVFGNLTKGCKP